MKLVLVVSVAVLVTLGAGWPWELRVLKCSGRPARYTTARARGAPSGRSFADCYRPPARGNRAAALVVAMVTPFHKRAPPTNASALQPSRTPAGSLRSNFALPPPTTT